MCYTGACEFETYPQGMNEGCVCTNNGDKLCPLVDDNIPNEDWLIQKDFDNGD